MLTGFNEFWREASQGRMLRHKSLLDAVVCACHHGAQLTHSREHGTLTLSCISMSLQAQGGGGEPPTFRFLVRRRGRCPHFGAIFASSEKIQPRAASAANTGSSNRNQRPLASCPKAGPKKEDRASKTPGAVQPRGALTVSLESRL